MASLAIVLGLLVVRCGVIDGQGDVKTAPVVKDEAASSGTPDDVDASRDLDGRDKDVNGSSGESLGNSQNHRDDGRAKDEKTEQDGQAASKGVRSLKVAQSLEKEARNQLESYRGMGECVLVRSGFIDLLGNAWSCVVQGDGWVDVCVIQRCAGEDDSCKVTTCRMDVSEWEESANESGLVEKVG